MDNCAGCDDLIASFEESHYARPAPASAKRKGDDDPTVEIKRTRSGSAFGSMGASSPSDKAEHGSTKTPSPRAQGASDDEMEEDALPANFGAMYLHKSAFDYVVSKDEELFQSSGLSDLGESPGTGELKDLDRIRAQIFEGAYSANPEAILADAKKLAEACLKSPDKFPPIESWKADNVKYKAKRLSDHVDKALDKVSTAKWLAPDCGFASMTLVTDDGAAPYLLGTCEENVLWKRALGGSEWVLLGGAPTGIISLSAGTDAGGDAALFCLDCYNVVWSRKLSGDAAWSVFETRPGEKQDLVALAAVEGTLYAASTGDELLSCKIDGTAGWAQVQNAAGPVEAVNVSGLAAHGGRLFASNDADELWSMDLKTLKWEQSDAPLLPESVGLSVYESDSAVSLISANFDSVWQRPLSQVGTRTNPPGHMAKHLVSLVADRMVCAGGRVGARVPSAGGGCGGDGADPLPAQRRQGALPHAALGPDAVRQQEADQRRLQEQRVPQAEQGIRPAEGRLGCARPRRARRLVHPLVP